MKKFLKENKSLSILAFISLTIIIIYILSVYFPQNFPNTDTWLELLFQLSIGYIINFIFYILQVYLPRRKMEINMSKHIKKRLTKLYGYMNGLFSQLCRLYCPGFDVNCLTKENLSQILKSIKLHNYVAVIDPAKTMLQEQHYTVKEWMIHCMQGVESEIDKLYKYYGQYLSSELINVLEEICSSNMHNSMGRTLLVSTRDVNFSQCNDDIFLSPYYENMKGIDNKIRALK